MDLCDGLDLKSSYGEIVSLKSLIKSLRGEVESAEFTNIDNLPVSILNFGRSLFPFRIRYDGAHVNVNPRSIVIAHYIPAEIVRGGCVEPSGGKRDCYIGREHLETESAIAIDIIDGYDERIFARYGVLPSAETRVRFKQR